VVDPVNSPPVTSPADMPVAVYRPHQRHELGLFRTWVVMAGNIWRARELVWQLFKRDFFAAYKKSFLGITWVFVSPLMGIVSWLFLKQAGVLTPGEMGVPYPAYVLIGSSMWGLFMGLFSGAADTLESGKELILQVNYPHEALLFKQTAQQLANFSIGLVFNLVLLLVMKVAPAWTTVLLPLVALPLFLLAAAIGLVVSMINVVATDITRIIRMGLTLLMYGTPIIYSADIPNETVQAIIRWNPLTHLVCSCRDIILFGRLHDVGGYFVCAALAVLVFLISWRLFYVSEDKIVERIL
jgi:lipopolysaccharide transport system permease protein